jgi:hypothetical protein
MNTTVKGIKSGGLVDNNGNYSFVAPLTAGKYTLVFAGVGFQQQEVSLTAAMTKIIQQMYNSVIGYRNWMR